MLDQMKRHDWSRTLLWLIYLALLGVLLPHTAWAFGQFEAPRWSWLGWVAAIAFEGAIAAFTWRLKQLIESTPNHKDPWLRWRKRYLNINSAGLLVAIAVSSAANWAHAEQYGKAMDVFGRYSVPAAIYTVAFGGILPLCSLLFARILADVQEVEQEANAEVVTLKAERRELQKELKAAEARANGAEARANEAEAAARLILDLAAKDKAQRIHAAHALAGRLPFAVPQTAIAALTDTSASYVSDVLRRGGNGSAE